MHFTRLLDVVVVIGPIVTVGPRVTVVVDPVNGIVETVVVGITVTVVITGSGVV